jgi:hypothetical protein
MSDLISNVPVIPLPPHAVSIRPATFQQKGSQAKI